MGFNAGDNNIYRYVGNNPANRRDPDGTIAIAQHDGGISTSVAGGHPNTCRGWVSLIESAIHATMATGGQFLAGGLCMEQSTMFPPRAHGGRAQASGQYSVGDAHCNGLERRYSTRRLQRADDQATYPGSPTNHRRHIPRGRRWQNNDSRSIDGSASNDWGEDAAGWTLSKCQTPRRVHMKMHPSAYMKATDLLQVLPRSNATDRPRPAHLWQHRRLALLDLSTGSKDGTDLGVCHSAEHVIASITQTIALP